MLLRRCIEFGIIAATVITGIVLFLRSRRKVDAMDGFEGIVTEVGGVERLEGYDWQMEAFNELESKKRK